MHGDLIEEELQDILGAAAPPGIVITLRRHDEYEKLIERIRSLEADKRSLNSQLASMSMYPVLYIQALDELKICRRALQQAGLDVSFIQSLRPRRF